jgi:DNA-binding CsgD family transcriptional regulator
VVALFHVGRRGEGEVPADDVDVLDAFASAYSLLHERMLNTERVHQQRTSIARAAARLTEEADRIAAAAISFDDDDTRVDAPAVAADSPLAATLSDRERQVFERLVLGASNAEIADELVITVETVKTHVKRILRKIGAINRSEAIALYLDEAKSPRRHNR